MKAWSDGIANAIRAVKADRESLKLQREFNEKTGNPVDTKQ
jgi:creatinine amidohydrolase